MLVYKYKIREPLGSFLLENEVRDGYKRLWKSYPKKTVEQIKKALGN